MEENNIQEPMVNETPVAEQPTVPVIEQSQSEITVSKKQKSPLIIVAIIIGILGIAAASAAVIKNITTPKYTITFDTDGGSKIANIIVKKDELLKKPTDPIKEDYKFVEWQLNGKQYDFDTKVQKDITLKAVWEIQLTDDVYTITFSTDGGTIIESQRINGNGQVVKPEDPTKPYYKFIEWQKDGEKYNFESLVKTDFTLTALWEEMPYHTVTFSCDGGCKDSSQKVYEGDKVTKPTDPKKSGYKFVEWQKDGQKYNFETPIVEDITLSAKYEEVKICKVDIVFVKRDCYSCAVDLKTLKSGEVMYEYKTNITIPCGSKITTNQVYEKSKDYLSSKVCQNGKFKKDNLKNLYWFYCTYENNECLFKDLDSDKYNKEYNFNSIVNQNMAIVIDGGLHDISINEVCD